ncbi:hypothetical protein F5B19DRAFT_203450 [Rostrohypoxylon terebratum]|nr:hypothetical protein F5B19DRAFT_203450 [Rostrohypoxylon terebratum]
MPPFLPPIVTPNDEDVGKSTKYDFKWIRERENGKKLGVWATFLDRLVGVGLNLGHERVKSIHDLYTFENIHTREAYPSREYVEKMVKMDPVKKYLERFDFEKHVYIVVGTKTVSGSTVKELARKNVSTDMEFSVNATPAGTPAVLGPGLNFSSKIEDTLKFDGSTNFVFAFRIRKIIVNRKFEIEDEDDVEGGVLGQYDQEEQDIEVQGMEESDAVDLAVGGSKVTVEDDNETVWVTVI